MSALHTASEVLAWAAGSAVQAPVGSLSKAEDLASPGHEVRVRLGQLASFTSARLGAGRPALGDDGRVGLGAVLLAAAVGGRADPVAADAIARAAPPLRLEPDASGWADAIARHGVAGRFFACGRRGAGRGAAERQLVERLLDASPLTAILLRPPAQRAHTKTSDEALALVPRLLSRPRGRELLIRFLAAPAHDARVLAWRAETIAYLARDDRDLALDIYLAARLRYGDEWDELLEASARALGQPGQPAGRSQAALRYWVPLAAIDHEDRQLLPAQPFLDNYRRALDLATRYRASILTAT